MCETAHGGSTSNHYTGVVARTQRTSVSVDKQSAVDKPSVTPFALTKPQPTETQSAVVGLLFLGIPGLSNTHTQTHTHKKRGGGVCKQSSRGARP